MPKRPAMADVLDSLGMQALLDVFVAEDIDDDLFWTLEDADLKELGCTLGQRKRLRGVIAAAAGPATNGAAAPADAPSAPASVDQSSSDVDAEQFVAGEGLELRRMSVMFIDMIGSTALAEQLSPDDMHALLQGFYVSAGGVARRFGGYVAALAGDGVIVLFGYPRIRAGNAGRALSAALAIQGELSEQDTELPSGRSVRVRYRVGVGTGPAIVGQPSDAAPAIHGSGQELHMVGQVMNRAARLQGYSEPGGITIDAQTREEAGAAFRYEELPDLDLKGIEARSGYAKLIGHAAQSEEKSAGPPGQERRTTIVGREPEQDRIRAAWDLCQTGRSRVVMVAGTAGVGKSTLLRTEMDRIADSGAPTRWLACSSLSVNTPFGAIIGYFSRLIGDSASATDRARRDALRHVLGPRTEAETSLVLNFLGLASEDAADASDEPPSVQRARLIRILAEWLVTPAEGASSGALVLEDAHWCDASTRDVFNACAEQAESRGMLLIATTRNAAEPMWEDDPDRDLIQLEDLSADAASALMNAIPGGRGLPDAMRRRLLSLSAGNPLMLESLTRRYASYAGTEAMAAEVEVPRSIYEAIAEQLDALPAGRQVAAALAVLDSKADGELIAQVLKRQPASVLTGLRALEAAGLIVFSDPMQSDAAKGLPAGFAESQLAGEDPARRATDQDASVTVRFYHQLYRDVVYERLVGSTRRALHAAVLETLRDYAPETATLRPEVLAGHALAAGDMGAAAPLALEAGERYLSRSSLIEAEHYLEHARKALRALPEDEPTRRQLLRTLGALAAVKRSRIGIGAPELDGLGRQMLQLARDLSDKKAELIALNGLYARALVGADYRQAAEWGGDLSSAAQRSGDRLFGMLGRRAVGVVALHTSRFQTAVDELTVALDSYDKEKDLHLAHAHGYDHAEICAVFLSFSQWMRGDFAAALKTNAFSVSHAREIDHPHSLAQALSFRAMLGAMAGSAGDLALAGDEAHSIGARFDLKVMREAGTFFALAARLLSKSVTVDDPVAALQNAYDGFVSVNSYNYRPLANSFMVRLLLEEDRLDESEALLDAAEDIQKKTGETWVAAEILRLRALTQDRRGQGGSSQALRRAAYDRAETAGGLALQIRIACDMAEAGDSWVPDLGALDRQVTWQDGVPDLERLQARLGASSGSNGTQS